MEATPYRGLHAYVSPYACLPPPLPFLSSFRTMHQGWGPGTRLAQPVCWEPRVRRGPGALLSKADMCLRGFPSTHWASLGLEHDFVRHCVRNPFAR